MNHLQNQTSPYLLQHVNNPVDWHPWEEEAFTKAKSENKPVFLSIGYAACHWCHVMAHESFENPIVAELLNQHYISIKVDREERPDIDQIYMTAVVALTGQGGWPLSVFLTPDLKPFYGGTYYPPISRYGLPSFSEVLQQIMLAWENQPENIHKSAESLTTHIRHHFSSKPAIQKSNFSLANLLDIANQFDIRYDWKNGGWGDAPKFPAPMSIDFLLQAGKIGNNHFTDIALHNLFAMSMGGIFDLVEGGFHRYSTDKTWTIPHFEKMLYDNAQLASAYIHAYQVTKNPYLRRIAESTLDYMQNNLMGALGGFYSSQDADSGGKEGTYYLWTAPELLGADANATPNLLLDLPINGHLDQQYLLKINPEPKPEQTSYADWIPYPESDLQEIQSQLKAVRKNRTKPNLDDKIILSWNALAINAFTQAGLVFERQDYLDLAIACAQFLSTNLIQDGKLQHAWRAGKGNGIAFLEDYAGFSIALLNLYQATTQTKWLHLAKDLLDKMLLEFDSDGTYLYTNRKDEKNLITPVLDLTDLVTPSGMALAAHAFLLISALEPTVTIEEKVATWFAAIQSSVKTVPSAHAYWLQQLLSASETQKTCVLVYPANQQAAAQKIINHYHQRYHPGWVFIAYPWNTTEATDHATILQDKEPVNGKITLYYCENHTCKAPITSTDEMLKILS